LFSPLVDDDATDDNGQHRHEHASRYAERFNQHAFDRRQCATYRAGMLAKLRQDARDA
jgi:hypothetical protein